VNGPIINVNGLIKSKEGTNSFHKDDLIQSIIKENKSTRRRIRNLVKLDEFIP